MKQSRKASLAEAMGNVVLGLIIQCTGQLFLFYVMHIPITWQQFGIFTVVMTLLSVLRSYTLRRLWNAEWWKRFKRRGERTSYPKDMPPYHYNCRCVIRDDTT